MRSSEPRNGRLPTTVRYGQEDPDDVMTSSQTVEESADQPPILTPEQIAYFIEHEFCEGFDEDAYLAAMHWEPHWHE